MHTDRSHRAAPTIQFQLRAPKPLAARPGVAFKFLQVPPSQAKNHFQQQIEIVFDFGKV